MRAMSWPFRTSELKSTRISWIRPVTWLPTCTVTTAFSVPVADTLAVSGPRSTRATRSCGPLPRPSTYSDTPVTATAATNARMTNRRQVVMGRDEGMPGAARMR